MSAAGRFAGMLAVLPLAACSLPASRDNVAATRDLVAGQTRSELQWRRDIQADETGRAAVAAMLDGGVGLAEAVTIGLLMNPEVQLAFEQLEIARSEVVAAATPPNPVAIVGVRSPGGNLSAFYPDRTVSVGVLQNVLGLLNMPDRVAVARKELDRQRLLAAARITAVATRTAEAWLEYATARQVAQLRERSAAAARSTFDRLGQQAAAGDHPDLDMAAERSGLFDVESAAAHAVLDAATARARLAELMGLSGWRDDWELAGALPDLPAEDPSAQGLEEAAMQRRLDVRAALQAIDVRLRMLAMQRRFRWLGALEIGAFREAAVDSTPFVGPNAVVELPLFDQHQSQLLAADAELRSALRTLEAVKLTARTEVRTHVAELAAARRLLEQHRRLVLPDRVSGPDAGEAAAPEDLHRQLQWVESQEQQALLLRDYWRSRSALAAAAGDWTTLSGLPVP
ncbi:MAG: TolC family protein [Steroidobacteraceae bacterium]